MSGGQNDDDDTRKDLTRIEDLSEFLHEEDPDLDSRFGAHNNTELTEGLSVENLDEDLPPEVPFGMDQELPPETFETEVESESEFEAATEAEPEISFDSEEAISFETEEEAPLEELPSFDLESDDSPFELSTEDNEFQSAIPDSELVEDLEKDPEPVARPIEHTSQNFDDVKSFAQNFSYGQIQGGGNPPFSLIIKNVRYQEDVEDIMTLLKEFTLMNEQNEAETLRALEIGSLLVPQISEYSAIVLAHKLRRFDCDIDMGLSDEIHPSKSGESNPKGMVKRDSLKQNKAEQYKKSQSDVSLNEILVTTTAQLEGYTIAKYIGAETTFAVVDEEELERLKFVQVSARTESGVLDYATDDNISSNVAFQDYQKSFEQLFVDLVDQLKVKAMHQKANALLGLNYQLTNLPLHKSDETRNCYQLTCSATLAQVFENE